MVRSVYYNGNEYRTRSAEEYYLGYFLASIASGAIMKGLSLTGDSFQKELVKEQSNNPIYREYLYKSLEQSGLDKSVSIVPAQHLSHMFPAEAAGKNACYIPKANQIVLNTDKISHAGFHEMGHALNHLQSKFGVKYLQKMRGAGYAIAGIMEFFAVLSRSKPKDAKRNPIDVIEDNCGKITFLALLPTVAEEAIASYRGVKLAKKSGLAQPYTKNLNKLYIKALSTYGGYAALAGLSVYATRKIMDYFSRPKKIERTEFSLFG